MRFASAYLGLIGLLSLARAMPMNQQSNGVEYTCTYTVKFLEKPPPNMKNPPSTEVDLVKSVVTKVAEEQKNIMRSFLTHNTFIHSSVEFENDYPFSQSPKIIYYSANSKFFSHNNCLREDEMYGWVGTVPDGEDRFYGKQCAQHDALDPPSTECIKNGRPTNWT
ncbi:hypothetical protein DFH05DRAFT_1528530 [Lentinula detonsa]|uniref:Uncharacterized protein n=1 Tax=Lentinula detonsa TaxID=2804962 RepID=A0A9W8NTU2_9AGAR|nr:hypothetical protein DFH05DRAFT_1528530 [Lentinula detonsa]